MVHVTCHGVEPGMHIDEASAQNLLLVEPWPWPSMHLDTELEAVRHYLATLLLVKPCSVPAHLSQHGLATSRHYVTFPSARPGIIRRNARNDHEIRGAAAYSGHYSHCSSSITWYSLLSHMKLLGRAFSTIMSLFSQCSAAQRPPCQVKQLRSRVLNFR